MDEVAYVVHHIAGRMRIRVPHAKGHPRLLSDLRDLLMSLNYVREVDTSSLTGSLLVHYAPEAFDALQDFLGRAPGLSVAAAQMTGAGGDGQPRQAIFTLLKELDDSLKSATEGQLDLRLLVPLSALTVGLFALRKTMSTPLWLTMMVFAFNSFLSLNPPSRTNTHPLPADRESSVWH
jgi:hypothetical protein